MAKGVTKIPERYRARVKFMGKYVLLGNFMSEEVAEEKVRAAEKAIKSIESTASRSFEAWLGQPQTSEPVKTPKPLTKQGKIAEELTKQLRVAAYMYSLLNFKGPEPILDWGLEKLEDYIVEHGDVLKDPEPQVLAWGIEVKEPYSDKDWFEQRLAERGGSLGKDKWGNTLIDGNRCEEPIIGFDKDGYFVVQSDEYNKIGEVAFKTLQEVEAYEAEQAKTEDEEIEDGEYGDHEGELPLYTYDFDKTATDSDGECYLIDNYETSVDPDYPEYMTWINNRGVAEFKTEY